MFLASKTTRQIYSVGNREKDQGILFDALHFAQVQSYLHYKTACKQKWTNIVVNISSGQSPPDQEPVLSENCVSWTDWKRGWEGQIENRTGGYTGENMV